MRDAPGYTSITFPEARQREHDLSVCAHCRAISLMKPGFGPPQVMIYRADGTHYLKDCGFCRTCWQHVCPRCDGKDCSPWEKTLDAEERKARKLVCT